MAGLLYNTPGPPNKVYMVWKEMKQFDKRMILKVDSADNELYGELSYVFHNQKLKKTVFG